MSNRKYPRLSDGYHERSPYHPYQTKKQANCIADSRDRERSPSGSNSKDNSPYSSSRHSNLSPRSQRSKYSYSRTKDGSKKGSSQSPNDSHHEANSHSSERRTKFNHISTNEEFPWSQHVSSSGKVYYYNFKTEKSQWEKPKEWLERERRKKETEERVHGLVNSKDVKETASRKDDSSRAYLSKYSTKESSNDKRDGSRMYIDDRGRENHQLANSDRGQTVIKTVSTYTSAQSTATYRTATVVATLSGNSVVSPAGSLQDVSPPSTPSSRASIFEPGSHSSSPQLISVSPHGAPYQSSQSPLGQSKHGLLLQNVFPAVSSSSSGTLQYTKPQHSMQQPQYNSALQYGLVNNGNTTQNIAAFPGSKSQVSMDIDTNSRPALHPLQQATLLHQRKLSENRNHALTDYQQPFPVIPQLTVPQSSVAAVLVKENNRIHQSPSGSPVIFTANLVATSSPSIKEQFQQAPHILTSLVSVLSPARLTPLVSPVAVHPTPTVNLQVLAKYVDKSLTSHSTNWPTEGLDKQLLRLNEESSSSAGEASRIQIQQIHLQSQLDLLEMRLNVGARRISSMKEVTKSLEQLLAESDKKSLM